MSDTSFLQWPFFEERHRSLASALDDWAKAKIAPLDTVSHEDDEALDAHCRLILGHLSQAGWLSHTVADSNGDRSGSLDVRSLCLIRETLARYCGLADFVFAMQGLGSGAISLFGSDAQKKAYLPAVAKGEKIAAFALSEPNAGSDVAALQCKAEPVNDGYRINGTKTWISNGGIADFYTVFVRTRPNAGTGGITAFLVDAKSEGLNITERIPVIAPHPLATLSFEDVIIPQSAMIGSEGSGFKVAMAVLDVFRSSVAAAALGFARRALDEAKQRVKERHLFGAPMADLQLVQAKIADMALAIDTSALLTYRAAWTKDVLKNRVTREAAMAKLHATETAQKVIDDAVQIFGGLGVRSGTAVEKLYREIRALRIYEGASEVQKLIIARQTLSS